MTTHALAVLPRRYAICRLEAAAVVPIWASGEGFCSVTRTDAELSIVIDEEQVPETVLAQRGFRGLKVVGPLAFDVVGVLASLASPLAAADIPIVALGTYDTDYLFVHESHFKQAIDVLNANGHTFVA